MKRFLSARSIFLGGIFWLAILSCRTSDVIARANPTPTNTVAVRTVARPTFTPVPPAEPPTLVPPPPPILPTRAATVRPTTPRPVIPARSPTPAPPPPAPPTADPYAGWYYKPMNKGCVAAGNTRIEGNVLENGLPKNGVRVRLSDSENGGPLIDDFITGTDPSDYKHNCPECAGKYRLGIAEGQRIDGNWWVYLLDGAGSPQSPGVYVKTHDTPGCNTATIDFRH